MTEQREDGGTSVKRRVWVVEIDDSEGQGIRSWLTPEGDDTAGHGAAYGRLTPQGDDTEGQGFSVRGLRETEDGRYLMEIDTEDDLTGQGMSYRGIGETDEDVSGQGGYYRGLVQFIRPADEDDAEGQGFSSKG